MKSTLTNTIFFPVHAYPVSFVSGFRIAINCYVRQSEMPRISFQKMLKLCTDIALKLMPSGQFFAAKCADDTGSSGIKTTDIGSVAFVLMIVATFWAVLNHCAPPAATPIGRTTYPVVGNRFGRPLTGDTKLQPVAGRTSCPLAVAAVCDIGNPLSAAPPHSMSHLARSRAI